jgi:2-methylcitrate dehydratase PrpD
MSRIRVEADEGLMADYPRCWPARVRIAVGPSRNERLVTHVPGDPARPFDRSAVRSKFLRFVTPVLCGEKTEQLLARTGDLLVDGDFVPLVLEIEQLCRDAVA